MLNEQAHVHQVEEEGAALRRAVGPFPTRARLGGVAAVDHHVADRAAAAHPQVGAANLHDEAPDEAVHVDRPVDPVVPCSVLPPEVRVLPQLVQHPLLLPLHHPPAQHALQLVRVDQAGKQEHGSLQLLGRRGDAPPPKDHALRLLRGEQVSPRHHAQQQQALEVGELHFLQLSENVVQVLLIDDVIRRYCERQAPGDVLFGAPRWRGAGPGRRAARPGGRGVAPPLAGWRRLEGGCLLLPEGTQWRAEAASLEAERGERIVDGDRLV
mmetsp:Transcript_72395/g.228213  ORF Transcript_72395/g.228213 Transcript_72395/m.228213 type:complete len:268 (-) Transcript_72395:1022-1825(-)